MNVEIDIEALELVGYMDRTGRLRPIVTVELGEAA